VKLVASLIVRNELDRYLKPCLAHLLDFCDEVRVLDDSSDDGTLGYVGGRWMVGVFAATTDGPSFFAHEGETRQQLLDWTLRGEPTHVLAIDADEFISDGQALRAALEKNPNHPVFKLCVEEVWHADHDALSVRYDGGWRPSQAPILYRVDDPEPSRWRIRNRQLACGREPERVAKQIGLARALPVSVLHLGWANEQERAARHARYVEHDQGNFHARAHLASIMWPDSRVVTRRCPWPASLEPYRELLVERINRVVAPA